MTTKACSGTVAAAVIIPHYNDLLRLGKCLDALLPQVGSTAQAGSDVEVVVVDNNSTVSLKEVKARYPTVRFEIETKAGAAHARNRGVTQTTADRLFFIDSDCVPDPQWIETALRVGSRADLVGGTVTVFDETPAPRSGAQAFETVFAFDFKTYIEKKGFSGSGNLVTWRHVFDAIGGFRAGMSEDLDWCRRATAAGFSLVHEDSLRVGHPTRSDWPSLRRKWERVTEESWGLEQHGMMGRVHWGGRAVAMLPSIAIHAPRILRHGELSGWYERRRALATLARLRLYRAAWMLRQAVGRREH